MQTSSPYTNPGEKVHKSKINKGGAKEVVYREVSGLSQMWF